MRRVGVVLLLQMPEYRTPAFFTQWAIQGIRRHWPIHLCGHVVRAAASGRVKR